VNSLAVAGGKLYVGGGFSAADGHSTPRVAAFDLATGAVDSGFTAPALNGVTYALLPDGGRVYAGLMSGSAGLVALDSATGAAVPGFTSPIGSGGVRALASDGPRLYAGGPFPGAGAHAVPGAL